MYFFEEVYGYKFETEDWILRSLSRKFRSDCYMYKQETHFVAPAGNQ